jgi:hypothetical protein
MVAKDYSEEQRRNALDEDLTQTSEFRSRVSRALAGMEPDDPIAAERAAIDILTEIGFNRLTAIEEELSRTRQKLSALQRWLREEKAPPERKPEVREVVYFISMQGLIKVGYTKNFLQRMRAYGPCELLCVVEGGRAEEALVHQTLRHDLHHGAEWYNDTEFVRQVITGMQDKGWDIQAQMPPMPHEVGRSL